MLSARWFPRPVPLAKGFVLAVMLFVAAVKRFRALVMGFGSAVRLFVAAVKRFCAVVRRLVVVETDPCTWMTVPRRRVKGFCRLVKGSVRLVTLSWVAEERSCRLVIDPVRLVMLSWVAEERSCRLVIDPVRLVTLSWAAEERSCRLVIEVCRSVGQFGGACPFFCV